MKKYCLVCNSYNIAKLYKLYDDRYGYPNKYTLYRCLSCNHKFINNNFTPNELGNLYSNYYPRTDFTIEDYQPLEFKNNFLSWFNGEKRSAFTYIPKNVKILDIGCGFGQSLGYHKARCCEVYGVEADSNIQKVIDKFGFNIKVGLFDPNDYEENFFDFITMDQVLEHTTNPVETLIGISKILKKDGKAIISIPNSNGWGAKLFGNRWINWHTPYHLQHFSKDSIEIVAKEAGLEIESIKTITSSEWLYYQWLSIVSFPKMGEKSSFWSSSKDKNKKNEFHIKVIFKLITIIHKFKINHLITRFFDVLGIGDNYILILKKASC